MKLYDILYVLTGPEIDGVDVKHDQQYANSRMEAARKCREEYGAESIYIFHVMRASENNYNN